MSRQHLQPSGHPGIRRILRDDGATRAYRVVYDGEPMADGRRKQHTATVRTLREARALREAAAVSVRDHTHVAPTPVTLGAWLDTWTEGQRDLKPSTQRSYADALKPVRKRLGHKHLQALRRSDVETLVSDLLGTGGRSGQGRSPRTLRLMLSVLSAALKAAARDRLVPTNVADGVALPKRDNPTKPAWSATELGRFVGSVGGERLAACWRLSALGLRRGEVLGLRWDALDLDGTAPSIRVAHTRTLLTSGVVVEGTPKSERSKRVIPLDPATVTALRALRKRQLGESLAVGRPGLPGYVASDEVGRPVRPERWSRDFTRLGKAAGLPPLHLHGLRHSALSAMHERGVPLATLSAWAGHHSPAFTAGTYLVSSDDALNAASTVLGAVLDGRS